MEAKDSLKPDSYRWLILLICYFSVITFAFVFQSLPPIIDLLRADFRLTFTEVGLLMSLFALPGIFLTIPAGIISDKYGMRPTAAVALTLIIAGTLIVATSSSFNSLGIGRAVAGLGALSLSIIAAQLLTKWFIDKGLGLAMGIYSTAFPIGTIVSFTTFGTLGKNYGWQTPIYLTTVLSVITLILFMIIFREPPNHDFKTIKDEKPANIIKSVFSIGLPIWLVGISWLLGNAAFISLLTFGPDFLVSRGYDIISANLIASSFMWGAVIISPLIGLLIDRILRKEDLIIIGNLIMVVIFLVTPSAAASLVTLMVFLGFAAALVPVPTYALPADIVHPDELGLGFGIITTCLNIGIVIGPFLVGLSRDISGNFSTGFMLMAAFSLLSAISIYILKLGKKNIIRKSSL